MPPYTYLALLESTALFFSFRLNPEIFDVETKVLKRFKKKTPPPRSYQTINLIADLPCMSLPILTPTIPRRQLPQVKRRGWTSKVTILSCSLSTLITNLDVLQIPPHLLSPSHGSATTAFINEKRPLLG